MKTKQNTILWIAVLLLIAHGAYLSHRISRISDRTHIEYLSVRNIDLVQPSGLVVGNIHAGNDGGRPEISLKQEATGHYCNLGFAANGTGPYLEMLASFSTTGKEPVSRIEIGAFRHDQHGIQITGGNTDQYPPICLSWITGRASANANQYQCVMPEPKTK